MTTKEVILVLVLAAAIVAGAPTANVMNVTTSKITKHDGHYLSVKCHGKVHIDSCYFLHTEDNNRYNVIEGNYTEQSLDINGKRQYPNTGLGFQYGECGIVIPTVSGQHNGQWICMIKSKELRSMTGSVLYTEEVTGAQAGNVLNVSANKVSMLDADYLQVMCDVKVPIASCYFLHTEDNKRYNVIDNKYTQTPLDANAKRVYPNKGIGFQYGGCGILIPTASGQHNGQWICTIRSKELRSMTGSVLYNDTGTNISNEEKSKAFPSTFIILIALFATILPVGFLAYKTDLYIRLKQASNPQRKKNNNEDNPEQQRAMIELQPI